MRISDWSSDVCSSDLNRERPDSRSRAGFQDMRAMRHPTTEDIELTRVLYALSDPLRLDVVRQLDREGEASCTALDRGRPKSSMSHHFRVLRDAGVVRTRYEGTAHMNRSEEHTSELQSLMRISYAVFCLKKKKQNNELKVKTRLD